MLKKLEMYGISRDSLQWFTSYLKDRRQLVRHGIPQGSVLGPFLFIVFINDLPLYVTSSKIDLYADDTTLTSSTNYSSIGRLEGTLNSSIAEIVDRAASNKLPIDEGKTKAMLITGKRLASKINEEMT